LTARRGWELSRPEDEVCGNADLSTERTLFGVVEEETAADWKGPSSRFVNKGRMAGGDRRKMKMDI
jgi:hypothetical protein